jgi:hypothetical protein
MNANLEWLISKSPRALTTVTFGHLGTVMYSPGGNAYSFAKPSERISSTSGYYSPARKSWLHS